ncbi:hypothetical protein FE783_36320 [Paenibacillus mesophilus]|uniref:hypothetical protein n=1 Tax=Paenibacillus mesophilus TaxID=2582849 RepID=UPI00110E9777|nr:hypothetical protein [Paenibacillus mesophilus]TMV43058.1 hypothetical protein FE783_36320 [Paenibacillus mesophilus]
MADILGGQEHTFNESFGFIFFMCKFLSFSLDKNLKRYPNWDKSIPSLAATEQKTVEGGGALNWKWDEANGQHSCNEEIRGLNKKKASGNMKLS